MWAAAVVIPLAAMALPIVLILLAVLIDALFLGWYAFRMWHDEWAEKAGERLFRPLRRLMHVGRAVPRLP